VPVGVPVGVPGVGGGAATGASLFPYFTRVSTTPRNSRRRTTATTALCFVQEAAPGRRKLARSTKRCTVCVCALVRLSSVFVLSTRADRFLLPRLEANDAGVCLSLHGWIRVRAPARGTTCVGCCLPYAASLSSAVLLLLLPLQVWRSPWWWTASSGPTQVWRSTTCSRTSTPTTTSVRHYHVVTTHVQATAATTGAGLRTPRLRTPSLPSPSDPCHSGLTKHFSAGTLYCTDVTARCVRLWAAEHCINRINLPWCCTHVRVWAALVAENRTDHATATTATTTTTTTTTTTITTTTTTTTTTTPTTPSTTHNTNHNNNNIDRLVEMVLGVLPKYIVGVPLSKPHCCRCCAVGNSAVVVHGCIVSTVGSASA
jgi:hypothetical protein